MRLKRLVERRNSVRLIALLATSLSMCTLPGQERSVTNREVAARVPTPFKPLYEGGIGSSKAAAVWDGFPYDRITLERTACFGPCPVYTVTLSRNGGAQLHAEESLGGSTWHGKKGDYSGSVDIFKYGKLCYLLKQLRFDDLPPRFTANWTDAP